MTSESSSFDSAALRREARRRRILENSEKRLRSITGRPVSDSSETRQESGNCFLHDFQNALGSDLFTEPVEDISPEWSVENDPRNKQPVNDYVKDDAPMKTAREPDSTGSNWMKTLVQKRFHFIILSVIVQLMYIFKLGYLFYNNIFCPFITVKLMEFWLAHEPFEVDNQEQLALVSAVFKGSTARHMFRAFFIFAIIASDFCLYIFMIVACDKLFNVTISSYLAH